MADNQKLIQAQQMYDTLCATLDGMGWSFGKEEEKLLVHFGVNGDDIPMNFIMLVDAERQVIRLLSPLSYKMPEDKRVEGALAACAASFGMVDGSFDYDMSNGQIVFRMTASYKESQIGEGLFRYLIDCACAMVDKYNDQFLAIGKGILSISDFLKKE